MTIQQWLNNSINKLKTNFVPSAQLDAEILMADLLQKDRSWLHAHPEYVLQRSDLCRLSEQIERRAKHEPLAYIRGKQEFYGREFMVSPDTLTPRPETETMLELLLELVMSERFGVSSEKIKILDIGTGSGCIVISAALEIAKISNIKNETSYCGLDISEPALKIATKNAKRLGADVEFRKFDLLSQTFTLLFQLTDTPFTVILANLPYVPEDFHINLAATYEPKFAIYGGKDGLDYYRKLFKKLISQSNIRYVFTEAMPPQHKELTLIAAENGYKLKLTQDLIQLFAK